MVEPGIYKQGLVVKRVKCHGFQKQVILPTIASIAVVWLEKERDLEPYKVVYQGVGVGSEAKLYYKIGKGVLEVKVGVDCTVETFWVHISAPYQSTIPVLDLAVTLAETIPLKSGGVLEERDDQEVEA